MTDNNTSPKVSIVIRTTGSEKKLRLLELELLSLKNQTYQDFEVIIVCETNGEAVREVSRKVFGIQSAKVKVVETRFFNRCRTTNLGFLLAKGDYIVLLDDDYILDGNWLEYLINKIQELPENVACLGSEVESVFKESLKYRSSLMGTLARLLINFTLPSLWIKRGKWYKDVFLTISYGGAHALCRRHAVIEVKGMDIELEEPLIGDDLSLALKLYRKGYYNAVTYSVKVYHLERYVTKQKFKQPKYYESSILSEIYILAKYFDVVGMYVFRQIIYRVLWSLAYALRNRDIRVLFYALRGAIIGLIRGYSYYRR